MIPNTALFMFGVQTQQLNESEIVWLQNPLTAGVILFTRNYENPEQIKNLVQTIRNTASHDILIAVDHEGGRVQRFKDGFTHIPPMALLGEQYDKNHEKGLALARATGYVMAYEVAQCDIDFSFAPVLDVQTDFSEIIGDRAFHSNVDSIGDVASAFYDGMRDAGMIGVGKHFPGHGNVVADSHLELPICSANLEQLNNSDLPPFKALIEKNIEALMPAHILYPHVDELPAGFSSVWLEKILRQQLGFDGCIISDDLDMAGAAEYGNMKERVMLAEKHCDLILLCNNHDHMKEAFESQLIVEKPQRQQRLKALKRQKDALNEEQYRSSLSQLKNASLIG